MKLDRQQNYCTLTSHSLTLLRNRKKKKIERNFPFPLTITESISMWWMSEEGEN